jgi:hypothetical protein
MAGVAWDFEAGVDETSSLPECLWWGGECGLTTSANTLRCSRFGLVAGLG